jgi:shikimate O-hydroxycinnamoyltransferase
MKRIPLSPIDHIFTGVGSYPIEFVFAYDATIDPGRLQDSLDSVLDTFTPLHSRLVIASDDTYELEPSVDPISIEVTDQPAALQVSENPYDFLSPVDTVVGEPLARVRLSQTPDGSVLGVSISHALVDGFSYFHFLAGWAMEFHGKDNIAPSHERDLLTPKKTAGQRSITPDDVLEMSGTFWAEKRAATLRERMRWDRFSISKAELNELLREAQEDCDGRLSHNDVVTAFLWKKYLEAWNPNDEGPAYVSCPVDVRRILKPFPRTYFGCAVCLATTSMERSEFADASLGELAGRVRTAVGRVNQDYAWGSFDTLEQLRKQEGLDVLERIHVIHPDNGILVTNLSRLPVQQVQFDAGPPVTYEILTPAERGAVVLPGADGIEVRVCHPATAG